jgi:hypothetical protein
MLAVQPHKSGSAISAVEDYKAVGARNRGHDRRILEIAVNFQTSFHALNALLISVFVKDEAFYRQDTKVGQIDLFKWFCHGWGYVLSNTGLRPEAKGFQSIILTEQEWQYQ